MSIELYWLIRLATILLEQTFLLLKCSVYGGQQTKAQETGETSFFQTVELNRRVTPTTNKRRVDHILTVTYTKLLQLSSKIKTQHNRSKKGNFKQISKWKEQNRDYLNTEPLLSAIYHTLVASILSMGCKYSRSIEKH